MLPRLRHRALVASALVVGLALLPAPASAFQRAPAGASSRDGVARRIDSLAAAFVRDGRSPGVTVAVVRGGTDTIVMRGYGLADVENEVAATPRTVYRVGSVTKQFTAAAIMRLVEQRRLSLDDTLGALLPGLPPAWRPVLLRQLLNHTSGIPSYTDAGLRWYRRSRDDMPPDSLLAFVTADTLDFRPGASWHYDNSGYILLGMIIERVTGHPYEKELEAQLFSPFGLSSTRYCHTEPIVKRRAHGYTHDGDTLVNAPFLSMTQPFSAGSLCSTVGDLARWNRLLATGKVVSAASYARMTTAEGAALEAPVRYGYGLIADTLAGRRMITHGGSIHGFMSGNAYFPDADLSVTVLANCAPAPTDALLRAIARVALGAPPSPAASPAAR